MARGDGQLSHDLLPGEKGPQDACGVFGVWAPGEDVAKLTYYGLYALQHRGQESAGIATSDGRSILVYKDMGLVSQVFDERSLASLRGHLAVGHCRYSTTGGSTWENAQPTLGGHAESTVALAHNGNLINSAELRDLVAERAAEGYGSGGGEVLRGNTTDTALVTALLADDPDRSLEAAALDILPKLRGAFCFVFMDEHTLYAARDPQGIRPLVLGRLERGWVVASETAALDIVGASLIREIEPGELIAIDEDGLRSQRFAEAEPQGLRLRVRLPRPPRHHDQRPRRPRGAGRDGPDAGPRAPGRGRHGDADAGVGHAGRDRLRPGVRHPLRPGAGQELLRRAHLHRPVARPSASSASGSSSTRCARSSRASGWSSWTTRSCAATPSAPLVRMLREAGAAEVHVRISSPPVKLAVLLRHRLRRPGPSSSPPASAVEEVCTSIGADSLGYISEEGMIAATEQPTRPAVHGLLHRVLPGRAARGEPARQEPLRDPADRRRATSTSTASRRRRGGAEDALTRP